MREKKRYAFFFKRFIVDYHNHLLLMFLKNGSIFQFHLFFLTLTNLMEMSGIHTGWGNIHMVSYDIFFPLQVFFFHLYPLSCYFPFFHYIYRSMNEYTHKWKCGVTNYNNNTSRFHIDHEKKKKNFCGIFYFMLSLKIYKITASSVPSPMSMCQGALFFFFCLMVWILKFFFHIIMVYHQLVWDGYKANLVFLLFFALLYLLHLTPRVKSFYDTPSRTPSR